jgi:hypothetical protein
MKSRYESIQPQLEEKLKKLEAEAEDKDMFWLKHNRLLIASQREQLEFLHPGAISPVSSLSSPNACEMCGEDTVFYEVSSDTYVCNECGICQDQIRHQPLRYVPESCIYKHHVHLHQILHEMQCLRQKLPDQIVADVRDFLKTDFSYERIKKSLRKLGYKQHYSMVYSIQHALDSTFKPLQLSYEQEEALQGLFHQYISLGPIGGKKNRLNYHFVLLKLSKMCGYDHILPYLHPPKGKKSIESSERIWREVCRRLSS